MYGSGIYRIVNTANGKQYIGSSVNIRRRWHVHRTELRAGRHHSAHLQAAWNKYGEASFVFERLWYVEAVREALLYEEQLALNHLRTEYNNTTAARSPAWGWKHTPEARAKISSREITAETREKLSQARRGRPVSVETRTKIAAAKAGHGWTVAQREQFDARPVVAPRTYSPAAREQICLSQPTRRAVTATSVATGLRQSFPSLSAAARSLGCSREIISISLREKRPAVGYLFQRDSG
jgi:group I intron endonuclease